MEFQWIKVGKMKLQETDSRQSNHTTRTEGTHKKNRDRSRFLVPCSLVLFFFHTGDSNKSGHNFRSFSETKSAGRSVFRLHMCENVRLLCGRATYQAMSLVVTLTWMNPLVWDHVCHGTPPELLFLENRPFEKRGVDEEYLLVPRMVVPLKAVISTRTPILKKDLQNVHQKRGTKSEC